MSVYYVNEHLIHDEIMSEGTWPQNNNETYKRVMICTTPDAVKKEADETIVNFHRPICVHNVSTAPNVNTRISSTIKEGAFSPKITIRSSSDTRYNSDVFIVALPYDGMIKPFEHNTDALAIFKSVILKSEKFSIEHEDQKYKRVAYFVCRPHHEHLGNDGWYDDACNLELTFAQSNRSKKDQDESTLTWTFKTVTVRFGENGMYEITSKEETAPYDTFNPDDIRSKAICATVQPIKLEENANDGGQKRYNDARPATTNSGNSRGGNKRRFDDEDDGRYGGKGKNKGNRRR